jgi:hypothetical protein
MKFFTHLLALIERLLSHLDLLRVRREVREKTIKEMNDEINRRVELAEAVADVPDPERDERLRSRFDRSKNGQ